MSKPKDQPPSFRLSFDDAVEVWQAIWRGEYSNRIAARYDVNPGRIAEVKSGKLHPGSEHIARQRWDASKPLTAA